MEINREKGLYVAAGAALGVGAALVFSRLKKYTPPKVWTWNQGSGGKFANINRPISGATKEEKLPIGKHPLQLYSLATPNGVKVTMMLEELHEALGVEYDAWLCSIMKGDQFGSDFVAINPNSKIPAMMDHSTNPPTRLFESASILLYLAEKFNMFLPTDPAKKAECINWVMWQMGSAPYLGGGFGHFFAYAPEKFEYPINRFTMETKRQLDVLDKHLAGKQYICGDEYSVADMAIWPWYGVLVQGQLYAGSAEFLDVKSYSNVVAWADRIAARPAAIRGRKVNRIWGEKWEQLPERHSKQDFDQLPAKI